MARTATMISAVLAAIALFAACGSSTAHPSAAPTGSTLSPATQITAPETCPRTVHYTSVCYRNGKAHVVESGSLNATLDLPLSAIGVAYFPDGALSLSYSDATGNSVVISAVARAGTQPRSTIRVAHNADVFDSKAKPCSIVLASIDKRALAGTFRCQQMKSATGAPGAVDARGTFTARP